MKQIELLLPAGNIEKMKYAIAYGANAVYFGIGDFSLRSMKSGEVITLNNINDAVANAHRMGAKAYVTVNIFAHNDDIEKLPAFLELLQEAKPDAIIFGDPGVYSVLKRVIPDIPLHVSTQANTVNYESVRFWKDLGIERVILARELSLREIEQISSKVPDIDLEVLVHGSLCVSYSGRCLLSDYMTNNTRKSNLGNCAQACRWKYHLVEETRPGQYVEITEDEKGTYLLNPKDIALIRYISDLINAGVTSFKIEGRTKSLYYASIVAKEYRKAINSYLAGKSIDLNNALYELSQVGNRGFTTGFLIDKPDYNHYDYNTSKGIAGSTFLGVITERINENSFNVIVKNQMKVGDIIEFVTPNQLIQSKIECIKNEYNENIDVANTNNTVKISFQFGNANLDGWQWGIIRRKEESKYGVQVKADICSRTCD